MPFRDLPTFRSGLLSAAARFRSCLRPRNPALKTSFSAPPRRSQPPRRSSSASALNFREGRSADFPVRSNVGLHYSLRPEATAIGVGRCCGLEIRRSDRVSRKRLTKSQKRVRVRNGLLKPVSPYEKTLVYPLAFPPGFVRLRCSEFRAGRRCYRHRWHGLQHRRSDRKSTRLNSSHVSE